MTLTLRHRAALKQARQAHQRALLLRALRTYHEGERLTVRAADVVRRVRARALVLLDQLAEAAWDLHDNCPALWALSFVIVMLASCAATIGLIAAAIGWRP